MAFVLSGVTQLRWKPLYPDCKLIAQVQAAESDPSSCLHAEVPLPYANQHVQLTCAAK